LFMIWRTEGLGLQEGSVHLYGKPWTRINKPYLHFTFSLLAFHSVMYSETFIAWHIKRWMWEAKKWSVKKLLCKIGSEMDVECGKIIFFMYFKIYF
jgi:hypothetical protein